MFFKVSCGERLGILFVGSRGRASKLYNVSLNGFVL